LAMESTLHTGGALRNYTADPPQPTTWIQFNLSVEPE
jgi:hypothetical protein